MTIDRSMVEILREVDRREAEARRTAQGWAIMAGLWLVMLALWLVVFLHDVGAWS